MESVVQLGHPHPSHKAAAAVTLCGVCAFLEVYSTQPLLPLLAQLFHVSKTGVGLTVSATTLGVAISAPLFGALTERLARKRVIVFSILGVSIPTLLAATSTSLAQLIFWRFLQGIMVPGIIAVVVTYIGEEWPPERIALIMSFYVSGTALGGFLGRICAGVLTDYFNMPDRTSEAMRNLWFHTGDGVRRDAEGWYYFVDRLKDSIRRRGENISSYEVEQAVLGHPRIVACAAVAAPAKALAGEDEVALFVVVDPDAPMSAAEVRTWCADVLPAFAVPEYVTVVDELPQTPSGKIRKVVLRELAAEQARSATPSA